MPIRPQTLSPVRQPVEAARGLPNAHYTDPDVHAAEMRHLMHDGWAGLAVDAQVPEPGDALPLTFLGMPLLLLRDAQGAVRVFHNICRHRGMILVDAPRRIKGVIRCPYHSWCYSTKGALVTTPHVGGPGQNTHPAIDRASLGLIEVASHLRFGVVWINLSGTAAPFEVHHAELLRRWAEFDRPMVHGGSDSQFTLELEGNWKLAVENYCESYHLPWVHPGLNSYSRLEDHYHIEQPDSYSGQGTLVYRQLAGEDGAVFPDLPGLSDKWDKGAEYLSVFPNVLLGVHRDHAYAILLHPLGQSRTREEVHIYYARPETDAALRARNTAQWKQVFEEDIFVVEGMQRGRASDAFDGGRFSPVMDSPTHLFHAWVAGRMEAADQAPAPLAAG